MDTTPLWKAISEADKQEIYPPLNQNIEVDVAIIGGGITGITTALHLTNAGKKVAVLEANRIGEGTTGFSTGNLYIAVQPYYQNILSKFNLETAKVIAHSRKLAIDYIENNVQDKNISCNFSRRPWYLYTDNDNELSFLEKEVEVLKKTQVDIDYTISLPLSLKFKKAAIMPNQARFNPLKYVEGLANYLHKKNCFIFENTRCTHMKCIVNWNNAEKSWDCPCHGSRFSQKEKVLEGPAMSDLQKKNL